MVHVGKAGLISAECQPPRSSQVNQELLGRSSGRGSREGRSLWRDIEREKVQEGGRLYQLSSAGTWCTWSCLGNRKISEVTGRGSHWAVGPHGTPWRPWQLWAGVVAAVSRNLQGYSWARGSCRVR